jgi:carotenoid cleavage dioxygenase-like enzyme
VLVAQGFVGVAARAGADIKPVWFAIDTEARHIACAYGREETVVVYATGPSLVQWTFDRRALTVESDVLDASPHTFATSNRRQPGSPQRFLWAVGSGAAHKHDLFTGDRRSHDFAERRTPADLVYLADPDRSSTEDGDPLVGFVHDRAGDQAEFVVLDAENIEEPAAATVHIQRRVPCGGRGTWIPAHQSKALNPESTRARQGDEATATRGSNLFAIVGSRREARIESSARL